MSGCLIGQGKRVPKMRRAQGRAPFPRRGWAALRVEGRLHEVRAQVHQELGSLRPFVFKYAERTEQWED